MVLWFSVDRCQPDARSQKPETVQVFSVSRADPQINEWPEYICRRKRGNHGGNLLLRTQSPLPSLSSGFENWLRSGKYAEIKTLY
jgi:hypothetical protein